MTATHSRMYMTLRVKEFPPPPPPQKDNGENIMSFNYVRAPDSSFGDICYVL